MFHEQQGNERSQQLAVCLITPALGHPPMTIPSGIT